MEAVFVMILIPEIHSKIKQEASQKANMAKRIPKWDL